MQWAAVTSRLPAGLSTTLAVQKWVPSSPDGVTVNKAPTVEDCRYRALCAWTDPADGPTEMLTAVAARTAGRRRTDRHAPRRIHPPPPPSLALTRAHGPGPVAR